jgi:N-glycosylase/DNA lyase
VFQLLQVEGHGICSYNKGEIATCSPERKQTSFFDRNEEDREFCRYYFDLDRDYGKIKKELLIREKKLQKAIQEKSGIRILNQEFYEMVISFIISQNKSILHIKQIIRTLCEKYGEIIEEIHGKNYYSFPTISCLSEITEEKYRECKTGFRAPYLVCASRFLATEEYSYENLKDKSSEEIKEQLTRIKGIGDKVAGCIMLFGLGRGRFFP